jgi:hypothetical protein
MQCTIETITPERAAYYLSLNNHNRPLNQRHVEFLVEEIKEGRWRLNGESIKLNGTRLLDGQHRLSAIAMSGESVQSLVVRDIDCNVFDTIDLNRRRGGSDVLAVIGEQNYTQLASTLQFIHAYRSGTFLNSYRLSATKVQEELSLFPGCRKSVAMAKQSGLTMPLSVAAGVHFLASLIDQEKADQFLSDLISGASLSTDDPVLLLRNRMIQNRQSNARLDKSYIAALTIKAVNARLSNLKVRHLRWTTSGRGNETFPSIVGLPPSDVLRVAQASNTAMTEA